MRSDASLAHAWEDDRVSSVSVSKLGVAINESICHLSLKRQ